MNKERAINILLDFAKTNCEAIGIRQKVGYTEKVSDDLTAAILFLEKDIQSNKKDAKVEVKGISFDVRKGV
jgi:hypothetical protein